MTKQNTPENMAENSVGTSRNFKDNANPRSEELKPNRTVTGAGETSITENVRGGSSAGGVTGTGGVSTNDVGKGKTTKNPLKER